MEPLNKEKRIKREIANSNERRRMQSINAGFQKLKRLLPVNDGEKISKANILQHAADFITNIERDRIMLAEQNTLLRRILLDLKGGKIDLDTALSPVNSPTANSMLSVPLKLTMADLDSQDSTPMSTPQGSPSSPNLEMGVSPLTTPTMLLATSIKTSKTTKLAQGAAITTSNIVNSNNQIQSTKTTKTTRTPKNPRKTTRNTTKNNTERGTGAARGHPVRNSKHAVDMVAQINQNVNVTTASSLRKSINCNVGSGGNINDLIACNNNNNNNINTNSNTNSNVNSNNISALNMSCGAAVTNDINNQNIGSVAEIISDKNASPKNGLQTPGGAAKAAIALPLEVPYTSEVVIKSSTHSHHHAPPLAPAAAHHHSHHPQQQRPSDDFEAELMTGARKLMKTSGSSGLVGPLQGSAHDVADAGASKGQNLDTICKAIMEIEGDRVFKIEP